MIDIKKAFPSKEQFISYDLTDNCNELFNAQVRGFNSRKEKAPNLKALLKTEIERLEAWRNNINPPQTSTYDKINLYPYFKEGWELCIKGLFEYPNSGYKFCNEVIEQIKTKYSKRTPPAQYFKKLSKVAINEVIEGMAMAKFYFWLKELQEGQRALPPDTKSKTKISLTQLALILHYTGEAVTRETGNDLAKQYGHNSGEKLFQLFTKFHSRQNRIGKEGTHRKNLNKLTLLQSVIPQLPKDARQKATDEMNTFKAALANES